ncbi:hypothetical protein BDD14_2633 [Edaphobacter modestus]|uniref:Uncharacterized protein n=1 Tax=Edaphobacter modestus TaxID=388466 RepID=A0A4Q7YTJ0_9BACT|nr:hypothetical protein BDD14_2633 [Edaphobacter modestus]
MFAVLPLVVGRSSRCILSRTIFTVQYGLEGACPNDASPFVVREGPNDRLDIHTRIHSNCRPANSQLGFSFRPLPTVSKLAFTAEHFTSKKSGSGEAPPSLLRPNASTSANCRNVDTGTSRSRSTLRKPERINGFLMNLIDTPRRRSTLALKVQMKMSGSRST